MASISPVDLKMKFQKDVATIDVKYAVTFDNADRGQRYTELCRIIGDDTNVGDTPEAGDDDPLAYLAPLYYREFRVERPRTVQRDLHVQVPASMLDEDYGPIPNPDELRALVTLVPIQQPMVHQESNMVRKWI